MAHMTISFQARQYEDFDDCLAAAAEDYAAKHPEAAGYDMRPRWADDDYRTVILLDVPADSGAPKTAGGGRGSADSHLTAQPQCEEEA